MTLIDLDGRWELESPQQLDATFARRDGEDFNFYTLTPTGAEYPSLQILVRGNVAVLTYLPKEYDPGYTSVAHASTAATDLSGTTTFRISANRADDVEFTNAALVPVEAAMAAAKEFMSCPKLPTSVQWDAL